MPEGPVGVGEAAEKEEVLIDQFDECPEPFKSPISELGFLEVSLKEKKIEL